MKHCHWLTRSLLAATLVLAMVTPLILADTLRLNDGSKVVGHVIPQDDTYWVKLPDGTTKTVKKSDVAEWIHGDGDGSGTLAPAGAPGNAATPTAGPTTHPALSFSATKGKADRAEVPLAAVAIWQAFIDGNPGSLDLASAKQEKDAWQKRVDTNAEKINGKWIGGDERKALLDKVADLAKQADQMMAANQTLSAVDKLNQIVALYPNHFAANFWLGFINLRSQKYDKAQTNLETAVRLKPNSPEALTNYAIVLSFRKQHEKAILSALKAAQIKDSKEIVQNLVNAIDYAPPTMKTNDPRIKPALDAVDLLAGKYAITKPADWIYVGLQPAEAGGPGGDAPAPDDAGAGHPGVIGNGSGFIVSADGLIITNKHVASEGDMLIVRLADGSQKQAERVVIDDEQDLALIRIKSDKPLPYLQLASIDEPGPGAECTALGFPLGDVMHMTLQVTPGTVSSLIDADTSNVIVTCKVNPGNSGGPLVNRFGNVVGIVTQKTSSAQFVESYGKAISAGRIRQFLKKHADKVGSDLKFADDGNSSLNTEAIYKKVSPAAVCIIIMRTGNGVEVPKAEK